MKRLLPRTLEPGMPLMILAAALLSGGIAILWHGWIKPSPDFASDQMAYSAQNARSAQEARNSLNAQDALQTEQTESSYKEPLLKVTEKRVRVDPYNESWKKEPPALEEFGPVQIIPFTELGAEDAFWMRYDISIPQPGKTYYLDSQFYYREHYPALLHCYSGSMARTPHFMYLEYLPHSSPGYEISTEHSRCILLLSAGLPYHWHGGLQLLNSEEYQGLLEERSMLYAGIFSVILFMVIYQGALFLYARNRIYLLYLLSLITYLCYQLGATGYAVQLGLVSPDYNTLVLLGYNGWGPFFLLFLGELFHHQKRNVFLISLTRISGTAGLLLCVYLSTLHPSQTFLFGEQVGYLNLLLILFTALFGLFRRGPVGLVAFFSFSWVVLGIVVIAFTNLGVLPLNFFTRHAPLLGSLMEMIVLSFLMGALLQRIQRSRLQSDRRTSVGRGMAKRAAEYAKSLNSELRNRVYGEIQSPLAGIHTLTSRNPHEQSYSDEYKHSNEYKHSDDAHGYVHSTDAETLQSIHRLSASLLRQLQADQQRSVQEGANWFAAPQVLEDVAHFALSYLNRGAWRYELRCESSQMLHLEPESLALQLAEEVSHCQARFQGGALFVELKTSLQDEWPNGSGLTGGTAAQLKAESGRAVEEKLASSRAAEAEWTETDRAEAERARQGAATEEEFAVENEEGDDNHNTQAHLLFRVLPADSNFEEVEVHSENTFQWQALVPARGLEPYPTGEERKGTGWAAANGPSGRMGSGDSTGEFRRQLLQHSWPSFLISEDATLKDLLRTYLPDLNSLTFAEASSRADSHESAALWIIDLDFPGPSGDEKWEDRLNGLLARKAPVLLLASQPEKASTLELEAGRHFHLIRPVRGGDLARTLQDCLTVISISTSNEESFRLSQELARKRIMDSLENSVGKRLRELRDYVLHSLESSLESSLKAPLAPSLRSSREGLQMAPAGSTPAAEILISRLDGCTHDLRKLLHTMQSSESDGNENRTP